MNRVMREKRDMTYLSWSKICNFSGAAGSFLKVYTVLGGKKIYYMLLCCLRSIIMFGGDT